MSAAPSQEALALTGELTFATIPGVLAQSAEYEARTDLPDRLVIDSTCIKVHRCAGGAKGGPLPMLLVARKAGATPSSTRSAMAKAGRASSS